MVKNRNRRRLASISLIMLVPLGLLSKQYTGLAYEWVNSSAGDICYEIFWCLFIFLFIPTRLAVNQIPGWVFGITCCIEFLQLWRQPILDAFRSTLLGRLLLGNSFDWWDFLYYFLGCLIGWLWLKQLVR